MKHLGLAITGLCLAALLLPASALAAANDIPGTPTSVGQTVSGTVDQTTKPDDVWAVVLTRGQEVQMTADLSQTPEYYWNSFVNVYSPASKSLQTGTTVAGDDCQDSSVRTVIYTAAVTGTYYIDVTARSMNGLSYSLDVTPTSSPVITDPYAPDIFGIAVGLGTINGVVDQATLPDSVYAVRLYAGQPVVISATLSQTPEYYWNSFLNLYAPSAKSITSGTTVAGDDCQDSAIRTISYTPAIDGIYFVDVTARSTNGLRYALTVSGSAEKPHYPAHSYLHGPSAKVRRGTRLHLTGVLVDQNLRPLNGESVKLLYSLNGHTWKTASRLSSTGDTFPFRFKVTRTTYFRAEFGGDSTYASCISAKVRVRVK
jgi:hypothetical protein